MLNRWPIERLWLPSPFAPYPAIWTFFGGRRRLFPLRLLPVSKVDNFDFSNEIGTLSTVEPPAGEQKPFR
jgi:hypothetical protein